MNSLSENDHSREQVPGAHAKESDDSDADAPEGGSPSPTATEHERASEAYDTDGDSDGPTSEGHHAISLQEEVSAYSAETDADEDNTDDFDEDETREVSLKGKRVLLIEDERDVAKRIKGFLNEMGVSQVLLAQSGEDGMSYLVSSETFPDIVVLELALVGMDGIQFLAHLRGSEHKRLNKLPAVVITMLDSASIYRRAARQKVGAFLRKPVAPNALKEGLQAALRGDIVEKPFSQPKSWLDDIDEEELRAKREANISKASAKAQKQGFLVRMLNALIPWSGKA